MTAAAAAAGGSFGRFAILADPHGAPFATFTSEGGSAQLFVRWMGSGEAVRMLAENAIRAASELRDNFNAGA